MPMRSYYHTLDLRLTHGLPQIEPIVLASRPDPFDDPDWLFEPKYDGFRSVVYASKLGCEIQSRPDFPFDRFGELRSRIAGVLGDRDVILDGEVVSLNRQGKPVFRDLLRDQGFLAFAAFDLLWLDGIDLRPLPLSERKKLLGDLLPEDTGPLYKILTLEEHGRALFSAIKKMDLEGIVAKRKIDPYAPGTEWYTIRNPNYRRSEESLDAFQPRERRRAQRVSE